MLRFWTEEIGTGVQVTYTDADSEERQKKQVALPGRNLPLVDKETAPSQIRRPKKMSENHGPS